MNPDGDSDADIWDNFRAITLDPGTQQKVTLESGTYRQVESRYATSRDTLSLYSNEVYRPDYARSLLDATTDSRFATTTQLELYKKKDIAKKAREKMKNEQGGRFKHLFPRPEDRDADEMDRLSEHGQAKPSPGLHRGAHNGRIRLQRPERVSCSISQGNSAERYDRQRLVAGNRPYSTRGRGTAARRGRYYSVRGGRSRPQFSQRPNQAVSQTIGQEQSRTPTSTNIFENDPQNMFPAVPPPFQDVLPIFPQQIDNIMQLAPQPGQETRYVVQIPTPAPNNQIDRGNELAKLPETGCNHHHIAIHQCRDIMLVCFNLRHLTEMATCRSILSHLVGQFT